MSPIPEPFVHRLRVRYAECDAQGVVFNANHLAYVDHSLTELWRASVGSYGEVISRGVDMVVAEANVVYRAPARFDDELDIAVTVTRLGTTSMTTRHRITRATDGESVSDARLRYVWVDVATHASTPIPEWARDALAPYLVPDADPVAPSAGVEPDG